MSIIIPVYMNHGLTVSGRKNLPDRNPLLRMHALFLSKYMDWVISSHIHGKKTYTTIGL